MWNPASLKDRVLHYRQLAREVYGVAAALQDNTLRAGYLALASGWHDLALELERSQGSQCEGRAEPNGEKTCSAEAAAEIQNLPDA